MTLEKTGAWPWSASGYCDADFGQNRRVTISTSGYILFLGSCPVHWRSNLQTRQPTSTAEAELVAFHKATEDLETLRLLIEDVAEITSSLLSKEEQECSKDASAVYCDNKAAVDVLKSGVMGSTLKKRAKIIRSTIELVQDDVISPRLISGEAQCADILTKALPGPRHADLAHACGVELVFNRG